MDALRKFSGLFEQKFLVLSVPGRCVRIVRKISPKEEEQIKELLKEAHSNQKGRMEANVIVKDIFGRVVRTE